MLKVAFDLVLCNLLFFLIYTSHHIDILSQVTAPGKYMRKLTALDVDKDGEVQMYRKMGQEERDKVVRSRKLQPNIKNARRGKFYVSHLANTMFFMATAFKYH